MLDIFFYYVAIDFRWYVFFVDEIIKTVESVFKFGAFVRVYWKKSNKFFLFNRVYHDQARLSKSHACKFEIQSILFSDCQLFFEFGIMSAALNFVSESKETFQDLISGESVRIVSDLQESLMGIFVNFAVQSDFFQVDFNHVGVHVERIVDKQTKSLDWILNHFCKLFDEFCWYVGFGICFILAFDRKFWLCVIFKSIDGFAGLTEFTIDADKSQLEIDSFKECRELSSWANTTDQ